MTEVPMKTLAEVMAERRASKPELREEPYRWLRWTVRTRRDKLRRRWFQHVVKGRLGINHVRNYVTDMRYGGFAGGGSGSSHEDAGMLGFTAVDYAQLEKVFSRRNGLEIRPEDVLVDVGTGKGRVINWWLGRGLDNRIFGLELEHDLAELARRRLARWPNVTILQGDALGNLPPDATLIWMFNPFWAEVVARFRERLVEVYGEGSTVRIVYFMPLFVQEFADDPRFVVEPIKTKTIYSCVVISFAGAREPVAARTPPRSAAADS
jgi:hypothetical protein